ncbi:MAG: right-handed parallel beta-helix repeat-containing protein [bacterium]|nr:right-handed parallel beta-helix repeat-containing protein [bacterium]
MNQTLKTKAPHASQRVTPRSGLRITTDTVLEPGQYLCPGGIDIAADNISVEATGVHLIGAGRTGNGIRLRGCTGVTLNGVHLSHYAHAIVATDCVDLTITNTSACATAEIPSDTLFLDIWLPVEQAYGAGLLLSNVRNSTIADNNYEHCMCGILTYACSHLTVVRNKVNYCSGFGIHLFGTCDSLFEDNSADFCCRYNVRNELKGIHRLGHMGADAAGFLIIAGSHRNIFRRNFARMGGDGFFLAGAGSFDHPLGAHDNLFEENDASLSPNISFEATFARGNVFRNNFANNSNFGFWLGFSWENVIENNRIVGNRQAGIAAENAHHMRATGNTFQGNGHGILLWSNIYDPRVPIHFPDCLTSHDWAILHNTFTRNTKAIRIAASQDHGIRPINPERTEPRPARPYAHLIHANNIQDNRVGIELIGCERTTITENILHHNAEANIRQDDCLDSFIAGNLGAAGAYLA